MNNLDKPLQKLLGIGLGWGVVWAAFFVTIGLLGHLRMDKEHIALLAFLALAVSGGAYLTAWLCRRAHKRVDWHRALVGTFVSGLITAILVWFGYLLPLADIGKGESILRLVVLAFMWACGFAFVPAVLTVWYYRRRLRRVDDAVS